MCYEQILYCKSGTEQMDYIVWEHFANMFKTLCDSSDRLINVVLIRLKLIHCCRLVVCKRYFEAGLLWVNVSSYLYTLSRTYSYDISTSSTGKLTLTSGLDLGNKTRWCRVRERTWMLLYHTNSSWGQPIWVHSANLT